MSDEAETQQRRAAAQALANARLAGFQPDAGYLALLEGYVVGGIPLEELHAATNKKLLAVDSGREGKEAAPPQAGC
jgi:hypothetical protein